jgi:hypothetical protein
MPLATLSPTFSSVRIIPDAASLDAASAAAAAFSAVLSEDTSTNEKRVAGVAVESNVAGVRNSCWIQL